MINNPSKRAFAQLRCEFQPIAVKFCYSRPEGIPQAEEVFSFCQFVKLCQDRGETFYIDKHNDNCFGRMVPGMMPWRLPALQEDEESRRIMAKRMAKWAEMQANSGGEVPPAEV